MHDNKRGEDGILKVLVDDIQAIFDGKFKITRPEIVAFVKRIQNLSDESDDSLYQSVISLIDDFVGKCKIQIVENNSIEKYVEVWTDFIAKGKKVDSVLARFKMYVVNKNEESHSLFYESAKEYLTFLNHMRKCWSESIMKIDSKLAEKVVHYLTNQRSCEPMPSEVYARIVIESYDEYFKYCNQSRESGAESILSGKSTDLQKHDDNGKSFQNAKAVLGSFIECQMYEEGNKIYEKIVEKPTHQQVKIYYKKLAEKLVLSKSNEEYTIICYNLLRNEKKCAESTLKCYDDAWRCLVLNQLSAITSAVKSFLSHGQHENSSISYELLSFKLETLHAFCNEIRLHEEKQILELRKTVNDYSFCEKLLMRFEENQKMITSFYDSNGKVSEAMLMAARNILIDNLKESNDADAGTEESVPKLPSLIESYFDHFLRKESFGTSYDELEKTFSGPMIILEYVNDKDVFIKLYAKSLAKRLINSSFRSIDAEEFLIEKLKMCYGKNCIAKLEKMISDYKVSLDMTREFKQSLKTPPPFSLSTIILPSGSWPIKAIRSSILVPQELERVMQLFGNFYAGRHSGRKLLWNHGQSSCEVKLRYLSKPYVVHTSMTMFTILLSFNVSNSISMADLANVTGLKRGELSKYVRFLIRETIVLCEDVDIVEESTIKLNFKYENKRQKFRFALQFPDKNLDEQTVKSIVCDRKYYLQALIVKIMKANKQMTRDDLLKEVVRLSISVFVPSHSMIENTLVSLIVKEYLEKKENVYLYLA